MNDDPGYIERARYWVALFELIGKDHQAEATRYAAELDAAYYELATLRSAHKSQQIDTLTTDLHEARRQLMELQMLISPQGATH